MLADDDSLATAASRWTLLIALVKVGGSLVTFADDS